MTRFSNHPMADSTPNDISPREKQTTPEDWERHTPEWEGFSEEEKEEWLANHPIL